MTDSQALAWERMSPLILLVAFFGIPAAGGVALVLSMQVPRFIYGMADPFALVAEAGSLVAVLLLFVALRICLALPSAPSGLYRDVLDFLAMSRWHPAVKTAFAGLLVFPGWWYLRLNLFWAVPIVRILGARALRSDDFQRFLDGLTVSYQLALTGGVPLLFALHMLNRWKPKMRFLPWVLVPVLFVCAAIGVVLIVTLTH